MSLRRYRKRGGVLIRDSGTNYTVEDCTISNSMSTWVVGKGFWYSDDYITQENLKFNRIAYPTFAYRPVLGSTDTDHIEHYCEYNDFTFTSGGDYIGYLIYPIPGSDDEVEFTCCFHFRYGSMIDLKAEIAALEEVCLHSCSQTEENNPNVAFAFTQVINPQYKLLPVIRSYNVTSTVELGGNRKSNTTYNAKRTVDYYGNFFYLPTEYDWVQWWIIRGNQFLHGANYANKYHFIGILTSLGGSHHLTNAIDVNHFTLTPEPL